VSTLRCNLASAKVTGSTAGGVMSWRGMVEVQKVVMARSSRAMTVLVVS
jgi:hypothetical protein